MSWENRRGVSFWYSSYWEGKIKTKQVSRIKEGNWKGYETVVRWYHRIRIHRRSTCVETFEVSFPAHNACICIYLHGHVVHWNFTEGLSLGSARMHRNHWLSRVGGGDSIFSRTLPEI